MRDFELYTFPSGLRVLHKQVVHTKLFHGSFSINRGTRDEPESAQGVAHFWEHMAFKGTSRRNNFHILDRLDRVGGDLNAFTTKEKVVFHASVLHEYMDRAVDLLADILLQSIFPEKELEKERQVILDEMDMYLDSPEDAIQDEFEAMVFQHHSLGRNILGTKESLQAMNRKVMMDFYHQSLSPNDIIFSSIGPMPIEKVVKVLTPLVSDFNWTGQAVQRTQANDQLLVEHKVKKPINQTHAMMGRQTIGYNDHNRVGLFLLMNILGGSAMNSRLNMALRERKGISYTVEAGFQPYLLEGMLHIYFGCDDEQLDKALSITYGEMRKLRTTKLGTQQLHYAKEQVVGQMVMGEESYLSLSLALAKSMLDVGKVEPLESMIQQVRAITAEQLQDLAQQWLDEQHWTKLFYVPAD